MMAASLSAASSPDFERGRDSPSKPVLPTSYRRQRSITPPRPSLQCRTADATPTNFLQTTTRSFDTSGFGDPELASGELSSRPNSFLLSSKPKQIFSFAPLAAQCSGNLSPGEASPAKLDARRTGESFTFAPPDDDLSGGGSCSESIKLGESAEKSTGSDSTVRTPRKHEVRPLVRGASTEEPAGFGVSENLEQEVDAIRREQQTLRDRAILAEQSQKLMQKSFDELQQAFERSLAQQAALTQRAELAERNAASAQYGQEQMRKVVDELAGQSVNFDAPLPRVGGQDERPDQLQVLRLASAGMRPRSLSRQMMAKTNSGAPSDGCRSSVALSEISVDCSETPVVTRPERPLLPSNAQPLSLCALVLRSLGVGGSQRPGGGRPKSLCDVFKGAAASQPAAPAAPAPQRQEGGSISRATKSSPAVGSSRYFF